MKGKKMTKIFVAIGFLVFCIGYHFHSNHESREHMNRIIVCSQIVSDQFIDDPNHKSSFTVSIPMFGMDDGGNMEYNYTYTPGKDNFLEYKKIHDNIVNQK
jgi:hypothetical protein